MSYIINSVTEREKFQIAELALASANRGVQGFNPKAHKLTQSFLLLEQLTNTTSAQYRFPVLINQQPITNNEQRLNLQDSFIVSSMSVRLAKKSGATDTAFIPLTYNSPALTNAAQYAKLYNGIFSLAVNNNVLIPAQTIMQHYNAPRTQADAGPPIVENSVNFAIDSFVPVEPNIVLVGTKNNELSINLKEAFSAVDANTYIQIELRGILAQNSTNVA